MKKLLNYFKTLFGKKEIPLVSNEGATSKKPFIILIENITDHVISDVEVLKAIDGETDIEGIKRTYGILGISLKEFLFWVCVKGTNIMHLAIQSENGSQVVESLVISGKSVNGDAFARGSNLRIGSYQYQTNQTDLYFKTPLNMFTSLVIRKVQPNCKIRIYIYPEKQPSRWNLNNPYRTKI